MPSCRMLCPTHWPTLLSSSLTAATLPTHFSPNFYNSSLFSLVYLFRTQTSLNDALSPLVVDSRKMPYHLATTTAPTYPTSLLVVN